MKKLFLATTALVVLAATSAGAADMYARPAYTPPPPPLPVYSWTGLYFGGNVGYSWGQSKNDRTGTLVGLGVNVQESQNIDGVIGKPGTTISLEHGCSDWKPTSRPPVRKAARRFQSWHFLPPR
jgi:opacity protein-like surface antigen